MKDGKILPSIEVAIDIGGGPYYDRFLILEFGPWISMNCSFQGIPAPDTAMNAAKVGGSLRLDTYPIPA